MTTARDEFIKFVEAFIVNNVAGVDMALAREYFEKIKNEKVKSDGPTAKGVDLMMSMYKIGADAEVKEIVDGTTYTARQASGIILSLTNSGYVTKTTDKGVSPAKYQLSDKGVAYCQKQA